MRKMMLVFVLMFFCAGVSFAAEAKEQISLKIGTSRLAGSYQLWGITWTKAIEDKTKGIQARIEATLGPAANIMLIEKGINELGFASVVATQEAWRGTGWAKGIKYRRMRSVFSMYPSYLQLVSAKESGIRTIEDLNGKTVDVESPGTTPGIALKYMIEVLGIKPVLRYTDAQVAIEALKNRRLDVWARVTGLPNSSIMDLAIAPGIYIVGFTPAELDKLISKYPYFGRSKIRPNTYKGQDYETNTLAVWAIALCDKELPEDVVYGITKAAFESQELFITAHPDGKYLVPENFEYLNVPLHTGAFKYYKEIGQKIPDRLMEKP